MTDADVGEEPTIKQLEGEQPSIEQLEEWVNDGGCEATDGCWVEPDGTCPHGKESWMLVMRLI